MNKVYIYKIDNYESLDPLVSGYFENIKSRFEKQKTILLKPNLLQASPPERAVTTDPAFVRSVISALRKLGNFNIILGDSPGANMNYKKVLEKTGIDKVCEELGVEIIRFESFKPQQRNGFIYTGIVDEVDVIINMPKLKTHSLTGLTLGVKNLFGLIPGSNKVSFHRNYPNNSDLGGKILEFYSLFHEKVITLLDGVIAHEGDGPSRGNSTYLGLVAFSEDTIGLDMAVTKALGLDVSFCKTNPVKYSYEVATENITFKNIKLPISMRVKVPDYVKKWVSDRIYVKPFIVGKKCIKCGFCKNSCPADAIEYSESGYRVIDTKCIECFCCHEVCESDAIYLRRSIMHRMFVK
ncbi:MAG: DUF362 domain-containing protein [Calditerrivibrio sp.]|nr:DUF362 domain-containing protein [Calditerrivibrio sp.]